MATTNLKPANALMQAFMKSGSRPTEAETADQDLERILGRLGSTQASKAKYTPGSMSEAQAHIPLNGASVLRAALGANAGSINGAATNSAAALIRDAISQRQDYAG
ncbi:hypothetical protein C8E05_1569 [Rhodococcus wratislaviensis]|uniref:Uncharacterized protein n=1 Tax=Rhodococcus wratislaviensis TaxID=44752 RepID=A0AB38FHH3_RHOWR|nr:hypothetical protein [Rhodococcus wratislaviensis]REE72181.1 hypothetical protein C8E05_1569 [Rhodococcus wratislaviensis]SPZ40803.1 Uncharacterised protein [Rhodococcus wratislaviensis]